MSRLITLSITLLLIALMTSGCYTILQHPASEVNYSSHDYQADCLGCHSDYHEYPYGYFYGQYPDYWWSTPRWGQYYAYPWWWDNYWYDNSHQQTQYDSDDPSPRSTRGKKVVRRETLRPPYSTGTTNLNRSGGAGNVGASGSTGKQSDQKNQSGDDPNNTKTKVKDEKNENKENKKATRRGGGRSG